VPAHFYPPFTTPSDCSTRCYERGKTNGGCMKHARFEAGSVSDRDWNSCRPTLGDVHDRRL